MMVKYVKIMQLKLQQTRTSPFSSSSVRSLMPIQENSTRAYKECPRPSHGSTSPASHVTLPSHLSTSWPTLPSPTAHTSTTLCLLSQLWMALPNYKFSLSSLSCISHISLCWLKCLKGNIKIEAAIAHLPC